MPVKKLIFMCLTFSFFMISSANAQTCSQLESDYRNACNKEISGCSGLAKCQRQRRACPQQIDEMSSCEQLKNCMQELHPAGTSKNRMCNYSWGYSVSTGSSKCNLKTSTLNTVKQDCPGFSEIDFTTGSSSPFNDDKYNCEGQKVRYWHRHVACRTNYDKFKSAIDSGRCSGSPTMPSKCTAGLETVTIDRVVSDTGDTSIYGGPIDPNGSLNNLVDYNSQFSGNAHTTNSASRE